MHAGYVSVASTAPLAARSFKSEYGFIVCAYSDNVNLSASDDMLNKDKLLFAIGPR